MEEENDSIKQIEQFKLRIKEKGIIHQSLLKYLGISVDEIDQKSITKEETEEIYQNLKKNNVLTNKCEFREFLETISHLWEIQESKKEIKYKLGSLFKRLQEDIKNIFSEKEIFQIFVFCNTRFILLILLGHNIISINAIIKDFSLMRYSSDWDIIKYFYPEIRKYDEKYLNQLMIKDKKYGLKEFVEENDQNLELFYEKREEGVKEPKLVELIREDKIEEFISFIELSPIDLNEKIQREKTIFGIYPQNLTPIEYSALFGSVDIFKYLCLKNGNNNIDIKGYIYNIIECAIQGRNYEIIHLLEERKEIKEEMNKNPKDYIEESIKMHYNEIFEYLITNLNIQITEEITNLFIKYRNYHLFNQIIELNQFELNDRAMITNIFHGICKNGNEEIVKILMNQPNLDINWRDKILEYLFKEIKKNKKTIKASR